MSSIRSAFVQREHLDRREIDRPPLQVIDEAAGRGDDDVRAAAQRLDLSAHADAAEDGGDAKARGPGVARQRVMHLHRQFPRRDEDERARRAPAGAGARSREALESSAGRTRRSCPCRSARAPAGRRRSEREESP